MKSIAVRLRFLILSLILSVSLMESALAQSATSTASVGEVSLVLGRAFRIDADGKRIRVQSGTAISVLDRINTESNGHVHIRFIDDALVSVRPNSELEIVRYDFNRQNPELSTVKFNLEQGVTRSISGAAARAARERFRLNTPIAAIGVRGTDFVVSTDSVTTRALVNEGVIIMAPFSDACISDGFGPCNANALEFGSSPQIATLDGSTPLPRLLPAQTVRNPDMMQQEVQQAIAAVQEPASLAVATATESSAQETGNQVILEGVTNRTVTTDAEVAVEAALAPPDFTPALSLALADVQSRQLVWGRYAANGLAHEPLTLPYDEARADREVTVGNLQYGLFRTEDGPKRVADNLGVVGFQLNSAQAVYNSATGIVAMQVNGGTLDIDFQRKVFNTALQMSHDLTGQVDFSASGKFFDGGYFRAIEETQRIAGAVSLDGAEAGYLFERRLENGEVSGLTLWGTPPQE